jgi:hypothetical protein
MSNLSRILIIHMDARALCCPWIALVGDGPPDEDEFGWTDFLSTSHPNTALTEFCKRVTPQSSVISGLLSKRASSLVAVGPMVAIALGIVLIAVDANLATITGDHRCSARRRARIDVLDTVVC